MLVLLVIFIPVNLVCAGVLRDGGTYNIYDVPESITANGYPAERHHVTTVDGYILEMHRIPRGKRQSESSDRPIVFLMHGITAYSNSFIAIGPKSGLAYNLADAGFDVWMGNARGTRDSRNHTSLNPDDSVEKYQFFDFSFEEIGMIDLPTMIDYALIVTGWKQLHYIGHSQGGTVFLVMSSMRPEYNAKIKSAHLLAGVGYQNYFPQNMTVNIAANTDTIYNMLLSLGIVEMSISADVPNLPEIPDVPNISDLPNIPGLPEIPDLPNLPGLPDVPNISELYLRLYTTVLEMIKNSEASGTATIPGLLLGGAAVKQVAHYGQNVRDRKFRRWNYGENNTDIYGQNDPPVYNLTLITTDVIMHYTIADHLLDERDVLDMANDMPNTKVRKVARDTFEHSDFVRADDSKELVTDYIANAIWCSEKSPLCVSGASSITVLSVFLKVYLAIYFLKIYRTV